MSILSMFRHVQCAARASRLGRAALAGLMAILALLAPAVVQAGALRIIPTGSDIPTYVDTSTIARRGGSVDLVYITDYRTASDQYNGEVRFRSEATTISIDCTKKIYAIKAVKGYTERAAGGTLTESRTAQGDEAKPLPVDTGTIIDHVRKFACNTKA